MRLSYAVLGHLEVTGRPAVAVTAPMQRALLAYLIIHANVPVRREAIIEALWPASDPRKSSQTLRFHVSKLRDALDPERRSAESSPVVTSGDGYMLSAELDAVDAQRFEDLVSQGRGHIADGPLAAYETLARALALWRGSAYDDFRYELWAQPEIRRLDELRLHAVEIQHEAALALGAGAQLVPDLESLVREHPDRELLRRHLMLALYRSGRQTDALREYDRFARALRENAGLSPDPLTVGLRDRILDHHPNLLPAADLVRPLEMFSPRGYELRDELGHGPFGPVFEAYQRGSGECRAVRVVEASIARRTEFVRSFDAEAGRIAQLDSDAISPLLDFWRESGGTFLAYPYHPANLDAAWTSVADDEDRIVEVLASLDTALAAAGRIGLAHGGVHERNIFFDDAGATYLGDFGFRWLRSASPPPGRPRAVVEQPTAQDDVGGVADLVVRLLTGSKRGDATGLAAEMNGEFGGSGGLLRAALDPDPVQRPDSVAEFTAELFSRLGRRGWRRPEGVRRNPYKSLEAFTENDADDFFGREREIAAVVAALDRHQVVVVTGPSGVGKSSLVRAGVLPLLRSDLEQTWLITEVTPGADPVAALVAGLARMATDPSSADDADLPPRILLVIDQLEELYTATTSDEQRTVFAEQILELVGDEERRVRVLATIRADFLDRPLADPRLGALMSPGLVPVAAPDAEQLSAAITGPADQVGLRIEPQVVAEIVADTQQGPGGLPVMEYTLHHLAEMAHEVISRDDYVRSGGVNAALLKNAETAMTELDAEEIDVVRSLVLRLFTLSEDGSPIRRRALLSELRSLPHSQASIDRVIDALIGRRLLTVDRDSVSRTATIEIAHESLFARWPRLAGWIRDHREDVAIQQRLAASLQEWEAAGRKVPYLLTGLRLETMQDWSRRGALRLTSAEEEFLAESARVAAEQKRRASRRRSLVFATIIVTAVVAGVLAVVASASASRARSLAAQTLELAGLVLLETDAELAAIALTESYERNPAPSALAWMGQILSGGQLGKYLVGGEEARWVTFHPTEDVLAVGGNDGHIRIIDPLSGEIRRDIPVHGDRVRTMVFSPDGSILASGGQDGSLAFSDHRAGVPRIIDDAHELGIVSMAFSPSGDVLVTVGVEGMVRIWEVGNPIPRDEVLVTAEELGLDRDGEEGRSRGMRLSAVAFHPSGERIAIGVTTGGGERSPSFVTHWDPRDLSLPPMTREHPESIWDLEYTPDGQFLVSAGRDETPRVWDAETGSLHQILGGHRDLVQAIAVSPHGDVVVTAGLDKLLFWDVHEDGFRQGVGPLGNTAAQTSLSFNSDGTLLAGTAGDVRVFDAVSGGQEGPPIPTGLTHIEGIAPSPDGSRVFLTGGADSEAGVVSVLDSNMEIYGETEIPFRGLLNLRLSGSGSFLGAFGRSDDVSLLELGPVDERSDVATGLGDESKKSMAFSPDESRVVVVAEDSGSILLAETASPGSPEAAATLDPPPETDEPADEPDVPRRYGLTAVEFLDESRVIVADVRGRLRMVDILTGAELREPAAAHRASIIDIAVSPDGSIVASSAADGTLAVWDTESFQLVATLTGHTNEVTDLTFSPDSRFLATASIDQTVRVWDVASASAIAIYRGHERPVRAVAFTPDQEYVLSGGVGGELRKWDFQWEQWPRRLCEWMRLPVSEADWAQVMGDEPYAPTCS